MIACLHPVTPDSPTLENPCASTSTRSSSGSRRQRLWDLPHQCHGPLVGICLPLHGLRLLVNKALNGQTQADDYDVHVGVVAECKQRSRLSEALHQDLERRYARTVQQFKVVKTTQEVALLWKKTMEQGDVTGALWAALTHPRCDAALQEVICRNMHMFLHHAAANARADHHDLQTMADENAVLSRELGRVQERCSRVMTDKNSEIERLNVQLRQARADNLAKDSRLALLSADLAALKTSVPDLEPAARLQKKIQQMAQRQTELEAALSELRQKLATTGKARDTVSVEPSCLPDPHPAETNRHHHPGMPIYLHQKTVLCVGGRSGNVASYRDAIERVGGRFAHHDGGQEDRPNALDANLTAADLVICQTGCISHNAYWKVKDFCKRTGKHCVFLENPSISSLTRNLERMSNQGRAPLQTATSALAD
jgi:hypothetical protein